MRFTWLDAIPFTGIDGVSTLGMCWKCNHTSATMQVQPKTRVTGGTIGGHFSLTKNGGTSMNVLSIEEHGETEPIVCLFKIEL